MPTYILLTTLTAQGVQTLRSRPDRLRDVPDRIGRDDDEDRDQRIDDDPDRKQRSDHERDEQSIKSQLGVLTGTSDESERPPGSDAI